jgi:hypothetical protein
MRSPGQLRFAGSIARVQPEPIVRELIRRTAHAVTDLDSLASLD